MVNNTRITPTRQVKDIISSLLPGPKLQPANNPQPSFHKIENIQSLIVSLTGAQRAVLNQIIRWCNKYKRAYPSREMLSALTGYTVRTVTRATDRLQELGLITKKVGGYNYANEYTINPQFRDTSWGESLHELLPSLKRIVLAVGSLLSFCSLANVPAYGERSELRSREKERVYITQDTRMRFNVAAGTASFKPETRAKERKIKRMMDSEAAVQAIRTLKLTSWGKIKMSAYEAAAIRYADEQLYNRREAPKNPLGLFKKLCEDYCKANGLKPDWERVDRLKAKVPWGEGHYEVISNVLHDGLSIQPAPVKQNSKYNPKPITEPVRLPDYKITAKQLEAVGRDKDAAMKSAYETVIATGKVNPFSHFLNKIQSEEKAIIVNHRAVELKEAQQRAVDRDRASLPLDYNLVEELDNMCDVIDYIDL